MAEEQDLGVPAGVVVSDPAGSQVRKDDLSRYQETLCTTRQDGFVCMSGSQCEASALKRPGAGFYPAQGRALPLTMNLHVGTIGCGAVAPLRSGPVLMTYGAQMAGGQTKGFSDRLENGSHGPRHGGRMAARYGETPRWLCFTPMAPCTITP